MGFRSVTEHCSNLVSDRDTGAKWERNFGMLVGHYQKGSITPHQIGRPKLAAAAYTKDGNDWRSLLLPDITIWRAPGEHHEIKHKDPTKSDIPCYGLEGYRFKALCEFALETRQTVLYTIHDWRLAGALDSRAPMRNNIEDWIAADVLMLKDNITMTRDGPSYVNGAKKIVPCHYWATSLWIPLARHWGIEQREAAEGKDDFILGLEAAGY